jgi:hypothetical protein
MIGDIKAEIAGELYKALERLDASCLARFES